MFNYEVRSKNFEWLNVTKG